jgi:hypothetical protein
MPRCTNLKGTIIDVTSGAANTEFAITHNLSFIPTGIIVLCQTGTGKLYTGTTSWTTTIAYLKSSTGSVLYRILFFA